MRNILPVFTACLLFVNVFLPELFAQDVIFTIKGEKIDCLLINESGGKLFYRPPGSTKEKSIKTKKVSVAMRNGGIFNVYLGGTRNMVDFRNLPYDVIIARNGQTYAANEVSIRPNEISYVDFLLPDKRTTNPKNMIAAIFYKNQQFIPVAEGPELANALFNAKIPVPPMAKGAPGPANNSPRPTPVPDEEPVSTDRSGTPDNNGSTTSTEPGNNDRTTASPPSLPTTLPDPKGPVMPIDKEEFERKAQEQVRKLNEYIKIILESPDIERVKEAQELALTLFISDTSMVEVSSLNRPNNRSFPVPRFLNRLLQVRESYDKIDVTNGEFYYVSELKKQDDGSWRGTVTFTQRFEGYRDGRLSYGDTTRKSVEVELRVYEPVIPTDEEILWDVLLDKYICRINNQMRKVSTCFISLL